MGTRRFCLLVGSLIGGLLACGDDDSGSGRAKHEGVPRIVSVELSPAALTLGVGESRHLGVTTRGVGKFDGSLLWESSDAAIATVEEGLVTAVGEGVATISATSVADGSKAGTARVEVRASPYGRLALQIEGLPAELQAGIVVEGPEGFKATANESRILEALAPGSYLVQAVVRDDETHEYVPDPTSAEVRIEAGSTSELLFRYEARPLPLFRLESQGAVLPLHASVDLPVTIRRFHGFAGSLELRAEGLPGGVTATPVHVGANQDEAVIRLVSAGTYRVLGPREIELVGEVEGETVHAKATLSIAAVVTEADGAGPGTLPHFLEIAPELANHKGGPIEITFAPTLSSLTFEDEDREGVAVAGNVILRGNHDWRGPTVEIQGWRMVVEADARLEIHSLSFRGGDAPEAGGAIENRGSLTIRDSVFRHCHASNGGAIFNAGSLSIERSIFENNESSLGSSLTNLGDAQLSDVIFRNHPLGTGSAIYNDGSDDAGARLVLEGVHFFDNRGGAIDNSEGSVDARNCIFERNSAISGGALSLSGGRARLESCVFMGNEADAVGGAISALTWGLDPEIILEVIDGVFSGNRANGAGGAIRINGPGRITGSSFTENTAWQSSGGAVSVGEIGQLDVVDSRFLANDAKDGGALHVYFGGVLRLEKSLVAGNSTSANGGGISIIGSAVVSQSIIVDNRSVVGGGILKGGGSNATVLNSTIADNHSTQEGGGIAVYEGLFSLLQTTVAGNSAPTGGGIYSFPNVWMTIAGSILAENTADSAGPNMNGFSDLRSEGYNLFGDLADASVLLRDDDIVDEDPGLGELGDHGGPTPTFELLPGSPAIDAIPEEECLHYGGEPILEDQRGRARPAGAGCDIGAFEMQH